MIPTGGADLTATVPPDFHPPEVTTFHFLLEGAYLWSVVGVCLGFFVIALSLFICCWIRRRNVISKAAPENDEETAVCKTSFSTVQQTNSSTDNSLERSFSTPPQRIHHSLSMDIGTPYFRTEGIQPRGSFSRWNSFNTPRCSLVSLGSVQPDLYRSSDSEDQGAPPSNSGRIWFSVLYRKEECELEITLIRAKYLPGRGFSRTSRDPFVKIFLLPDEENFQQSKVRKRTLSPKFNETFIFKIPEEELNSRCLRFSVYDMDKRKVRHSLGHAIVSLPKLNVTTNSVIWRDLEHTSQHHNYEGDIQVSLVCNPYNNRLKVSVCKIENLKGIDSGGAHMYTKVQLYHGRKLMKTKKTTAQHVVGESKSELIFHETFSFSVPARFYDSCFIRLVTVIAGGSPIVKDIPHGRVTIGPFLFSRGEPLLHWQEMITNPRYLVTRWHKLEAPQ